jgi:hypothetical protein
MNKSLLIFSFFSIVRFVQQYSISSRRRTIVYWRKVITVEGKDVSKKEKSVKTALKEVLRPKPNSILGLRPKLYIYNLAGTPKKEKWRYWLRTKVGEAPFYTVK